MFSTVNTSWANAGYFIKHCGKSFHSQECPEIGKKLQTELFTGGWFPFTAMKCVLKLASAMVVFLQIYWKPTTSSHWVLSGFLFQGRGSCCTWSSLAGQGAPWAFCTHVPRAGLGPHTAPGCSGPHACAADTLLTYPSPQPCYRERNQVNEYQAGLGKIKLKKKTKTSTGDFSGQCECLQLWQVSLYGCWAARTQHKWPRT